MKSADLLANPFALLGVSTRDDRDAIAHALDVRLNDPGADESLLHRAQQNLMASRQRLQAETSWLIGLSPSRVRAILAALRHADHQTVISELRSTSGLLRANLAAQLVETHPIDSLIHELIRAYDEIDPGEIADIINTERAIAGFPVVGSHLVEEALATTQSCHLDAALRAVTKNEHPGRLMTQLVEACLAIRGSTRDFLEALAERYDSWSGPTLSRFEERLDDAIGRLRRDTKDAAALKDIVATLKDWDEYSQPRQLIFKSKQLDEPRSGRIYGQLRDFVLWLANDRNEYRRALVISQALLLTFPELPSVIDQVPEDIEVLKELARQAEESVLFEELVEVVEEAKDCPTLGAEVEQGAFGPGGRGVAGRLYAAFAKAACGAVGREQADLPWLAIRHLAIEIHNEHQETKAALQLIIIIRSFDGARPSAAIDKRLREDDASLRRELLWPEIAKLSQAGRWKHALERLGEVERASESATERQKIVALRQELQQRRNGAIRRRISWGVAAAVLGAIWLGNLDPQSTRSRSPTGPSASSTGTSLPERGDRSGSAGAATSGLEIQPPIGNDQVLDRDEIRYCLFQDARLEAFRSAITTSAQRDDFNRVASDWNSRCSSYRYDESDMRAVERELAQQRGRLRDEGRSFADGGIASSGPGQTAERLDGFRLLNPTASSADAREVQRRLATLGFYTAEIDGIWGPGSRRGLAQFKRQAGLPENADWDRATQVQLFQAR